MLLTLLFIVFMYLFAVESFTEFLYPNPEEVASYFQAAALPDWLFDVMILMATALTVLSWSYLYMKAHGRTVPMPAWIEGIKIQLYVFFTANEASPPNRNISIYRHQRSHRHE